MARIFDLVKERRVYSIDADSTESVYSDAVTADVP